MLALLKVAPCIIDLNVTLTNRIQFKLMYNFRKVSSFFLLDSILWKSPKLSFFLRNPIWHLWYLRPRIRLPYFEFETGRILEWLFIIEGLVNIFLSIGKTNAVFWFNLYLSVNKKKIKKINFLCPAIFVWNIFLFCFQKERWL